MTRSDNVRARLILESHYLFTTERKTPPVFGLENNDNKTEWDGPFIALQSGSETTVDAIGAGLMVGLSAPRGGDR